MKKILIISHAMELGGVEKSLLGLLEYIDYSQYSVDLFLYRHEGELMSMIPKQVNLLSEVSSYSVLGKPLKTTVKEGHIFLAISRTFGKLLSKLYAKTHNHKDSRVGLEYSHKYTKWLLPKIQPDVQYDLAISFLTPHYVVAEKVNAKKKVGWIHTDYTKIDINRNSEQKMWGKLNYIAGVSDSVVKNFSLVFPAISDKLVVIENILPQKLVTKQAAEVDIQLDKESINLLSIGRFCTAKNFDSIPEITKIIRASGFNVKWYLIGFGNDEELIKRRIAEAKMEEYVIILGKKENPYPYIKACDLYVQPSRYEGKCVAVREAQMLAKPVIITNYDTANDQLQDGTDGVIVPLKLKDCATGIIDVLNDKNLQKKLSIECDKRDYTNSKEIKFLYSIIS